MLKDLFETLDYFLYLQDVEPPASWESKDNALQDVKAEYVKLKDFKRWVIGCDVISSDALNQPSS